MLKVGTIAPAFEALDQEGNNHKLSDYAGQWILLYFYPRDNTPGCTTEACTLRDNYSQFKNAGIVILGVSSDSVASHDKFVTKFQLPFTLLADQDKKIIKAYEAGGLFKRISYLINPAGEIVKAYEKVKPAEHAAEVLNDIKIYAK
jgi:peroxiredoxin Q/BCP